ncbi:MAG: type II secretion system F family protein [Actinomycetota bacterium]|nr:type II secretion system F family protein [Actinomycetota bacterium]
MAPGQSLFIGLLMIAGALTAFAVCLDFGTSTRGLVRARLRRTNLPIASHTTKDKKQLVVRTSKLGLVRLFIRPSGLEQLERNLVLAGKSSTWRIPTLVMLKVLGPALLFLPLMLWVRADPSTLHVGLMIGVLAVAYALPNIIVKGRATERQQQILLELPDVLDQVTISIESGLGFEASLARVGQNGKGPLASEVARVVQDSRLGMSRRDAYQALADRTDVDDLKRFLKSIVQAEEFGVPISKVVRTQADELRTKRRQRAEEKAAKVALKLLFPMLFCMFPVLFILILTPAIVNMGKVL